MKRCDYQHREGKKEIVSTPGDNVITLLTNFRNKLGRFSLVSLFQSSLLFVNKAGVEPSEEVLHSMVGF